MSQPRRKRTSQKHVKEASPEPPAREQRVRWTRFAIIAAVIVVIAAIILAIWYPTQMAPLRRTIITVDDIDIRMDYFLKRTKLAGADAMTMLDVLTKEQIIKLEAPKYGIEVTPADIDRQLKIIAGGGSGNITESEFREWYRQQLNESDLTDSEFKEAIRIQLLAVGLHGYLSERVPTVAEQVHLYAIILLDYEKALKVKERIEAGEDFTDLAREVSLHESSEKGGELGWFPQGVLSAGLDYVAFNLDIGQVSEPIPYASDPSSTDQSYFLLMVSEKAVAREIGEDSLQILKNSALDEWLMVQMQYHNIKYNFNSEINAWINWQLSKMTGNQEEQQ